MLELILKKNFEKLCGFMSGALGNGTVGKLEDQHGFPFNVDRLFGLTMHVAAAAAAAAA